MDKVFKKIFINKAYIACTTRFYFSIMISVKKYFYTVYSIILSFAFVPTFAQEPISNRNDHFLLRHGREQFEQSHYALALQTLEQLQQQLTIKEQQVSTIISEGSKQEVAFMIAICKLKTQAPKALELGEKFVKSTSNVVYRQRMAFALAQHYFQNNNLEKAISYYEIAGIDNLSNKEIIDQKFELAYSYFNAQRFQKAKPMFAAIKELTDGKYYNASNYYYGLLAYNDGDYDMALKSFERIDNLPEYKDVVPYYRAEIFYFKGDYDKVLQLSDRYLNKKEKLFYDKELHLLTAQTYFEQKKYQEALPFFEHYYENSDKVRKEELYEMAYTYYKLERWNKAIDNFKQLSNLEDSLGQTSMYLLGDCYLKMDDKKGAQNAFGICADMNFNPQQQEAAAFLYAKLSYELGYESIATRSFSEFIKQYPQSKFNNESRILLTDLLSKGSNFAEAFTIISELPVKDNETWELYQKVAIGRALQLMQNKDLKGADEVLNLSLQQPINSDYEAIAYFWKSEIAYREKRFPQTVQFAQSFLSKIGKHTAEIKRISPQATADNAQLNIGFAQMEMQDYGAAQNAFSAAQTSSQSPSSNNEALIREADATFMTKDFNKALTLYEKCINQNAGPTDYAHFQKALILGLLNKDTEKIQVLNNIINRQPVSPQKSNAQFELAVTQLENGQNNDAIILLKKMIADVSTNDIVRAKAQLKLGLAYQESGNSGQAIDAYKKYITNYPNGNERVAAIDALRNLYINLGQPQEFANFVNQNALPDVDAAALDQTYYAAAENEYADNKYSKAIDLFHKYLSAYPNGLSSLKAHFYLAESYYETGKKAEALEHYDHVVSSGWSDFSEGAAEKAGNISLEKNNNSAAEKYFVQLRNNAIDPSNLVKAYQGLMIASFKQSNYESCIQYADTLMRLQDFKEQNEALLYKGKSLYETQQYTDADICFKNLEKNNATIMSAEARYYIAAILLKNNQLKEAEDYAAYAIQTASGNEYWMGKTYILMSEILTLEKDYFNAKATLQSIIKNTKDTTLKKEAQTKLEQVKDLEKKSSKLTEE